MIAQPGHAIVHIDPADIQTHTGSTRGSPGRHDAAAARSYHGALRWRASAHVHGHEPMLRPSTHRRRGRRDAHDASKKSAADAASTATVSPQRAERPSSLPAVLAVVVVVDAIDLPDSNHRSEAVLEHSRRSGGRERDDALALPCSLWRSPSRNWRWIRPANGATKRSASARKHGTADQEQDQSQDRLLRGSRESVGNRDARAADQRANIGSSRR